MIILGVDPGTLITGFGIIENRSGKTKILASGTIKNNGQLPLPQRLKRIFEKLSEITEKYQPEEYAIETAFYGKNAQSALKLGHARGVVMLAAVIREIPTHEYSPREVKKAIVGNGAAAKEQVQFMVKSLLNIKQVPKEYDVTDALAVALCHLQRRQSPSKHVFTNWKAFLTAHPEKVKSQQRMALR
jgi:crossover junction endodeoxyribonuclease RuvC